MKLWAVTALMGICLGETYNPLYAYGQTLTPPMNAYTASLAQAQANFADPVSVQASTYVNPSSVDGPQLLPLAQNPTQAAQYRMAEQQQAQNRANPRISGLNDLDQLLQGAMNDAGLSNRDADDNNDPNDDVSGNVARPDDLMTDVHPSIIETLGAGDDIHSTMFDSIARNEANLKAMAILISAQRKKIAENKETVERMKDLNSRNEQILKENEKTLKEAGKRLLDKVAEFTKELGTEGSSEGENKDEKKAAFLEQEAHLVHRDSGDTRKATDFAAFALLQDNEMPLRHKVSSKIKQLSSLKY